MRSWQRANIVEDRWARAISMPTSIRTFSGKTASTGQHVIWLMNGTSYGGYADLGIVPTSWNIVGSGDFNADGNPDILWENSSTGQHVIWLMNGTSYSSYADLGTVPTSWKIVGSGYFDGGRQSGHSLGKHVNWPARHLAHERHKL